MVRIQKASQKHRAGICAAEAEAFPIDQVDEDTIDTYISAPNYVTYVALDTGKVLGYMTYEKEYDGGIHLLSIAIRKKSRGKGLARKLMSKLPRNFSIFAETRVSNLTMQYVLETSGFEFTGMHSYYYDGESARLYLRKAE